ncbi:MAG: alpha/beta hydrolase [Pikeienuella sp.]
MRRTVRVFGRLAAFVFLIYLISLAVALMLRRDFIYPFDETPARPQNIGLPRADIHQIPRDYGSTMQVWRATPHPGKPIILFFMGNVGNLMGSGPRLKELALRGYGIAAMTYPGGGGISGEPSEVALKEDALRLWQAVGQYAPGAERVIYGVSLGSGIATWLSAQVDGEIGLALETPYTRLCNAMEHAVPIYPSCLVMWDERYNSVDLIAQINAPLLVLHGDADQIIPIEQGKTLFKAAMHPKKMIIYPGGRHNDLRLYGAGIDMINWMDALSP